MKFTLSKRLLRIFRDIFTENDFNMYGSLIIFQKQFDQGISWGIMFYIIAWNTYAMESGG